MKTNIHETLKTIKKINNVNKNHGFLMVLDLPEILEISIFLKTIGFYNENGHQRDLENHQKISNVKKTMGF